MYAHTYAHTRSSSDSRPGLKPARIPLLIRYKTGAAARGLGVHGVARGADRSSRPGKTDADAFAPGRPGMTEDDGSRRLELVRTAQQQWIEALTDLGGRNTLLYYKDRRVGTLDLAAADQEVLDRFQRTGSVRLTRLFRDVDVRADAIHRVQAIYRKARELLEERGIRAGYLASGMARWDELFLEPAAPVLLRGLTITPTRARHDDFDLTLDDDAEVNPVLLHKLASVYGAATEELAEVPAEKINELLSRAADAAEVPAFEIADRMVIGTFTYAKLPMVRDLQAASELLADSDVVAAIAGDVEAQELLGPRRSPRRPWPRSGHDQARPERSSGQTLGSPDPGGGSQGSPVRPRSGPES